HPDVVTDQAAETSTHFRDALKVHRERHVDTVGERDQHGHIVVGCEGGQSSAVGPTTIHQDLATDRLALIHPLME
ncbi:hypothetical protein PENTCL1PPCAC_12905, partial [Pristionchus entomophagus]